MSITQTFGGGIHPVEIGNGKPATQSEPIRAAKAPAKVTIPLSMHGGAPADCLVKVGDTVCMGQKIGEAHGFISATVHASVSGKVKKLNAAEGDDASAAMDAYGNLMLISADGKMAVDTPNSGIFAKNSRVAVVLPDGQSVTGTVDSITLRNNLWNY